MATIGTFTHDGNGFVGSIDTLTIKVKAKFVPTETSNRNGPDFRIVAGGAECGAAWKERSGNGNDYLSVALDDPGLRAPIRASLVRTNVEGEFALLWSRPKAK